MEDGSTVQGDRLLRIDEVMHRVGIRTTSIYKLMREGQFPQGIKLAYRTVVWSESSINRWVAETVARAALPSPSLTSCQRQARQSLPREGRS